jgi:hypothetical protein
MGEAPDLRLLIKSTITILHLESFEKMCIITHFVGQIFYHYIKQLPSQKTLHLLFV